MNEYKLFIREVRKQMAVQNMTQAAVANQLQIDRATLNQQLAGVREMRASVAFGLARILGISLDKIMEEAQK